MFENVKLNQIDSLTPNYVQLRKFYFILVTHIRTYLRTGIYVSEDSDFTPLEAMDYRMISHYISKVGEILRDLRINENIKEYFEKIEKNFLDVKEAFLEKNYDLAYELWFIKDKI